MDAIRNLPIRKSLVVAVVLAAFAAPTGAAAWPVIGDDPSDPAVVQAGHDWMKQHFRVKAIKTTPTKPDPNRRICHPKAAGGTCITP
jgi:hypothetical protein